jgi:uncharacterized membrane protein
MDFMGFVMGLAVAVLMGYFLEMHVAGWVILSAVMGGMLVRLSGRLHKAEQHSEKQLLALRLELVALREKVARLDEQPSPFAQASRAAAAQQTASADASAAAAQATIKERKTTEPATSVKPAATNVNLSQMAAETAQLPAARPNTVPPPSPLPSARVFSADAPLPRRLQDGDEDDESSVRVTSSLGSTLWAWLTGGNAIVRMAVLILFIGVAFLLRYAAERTTVPIELRLIAVALTGGGLVMLGRRLLAGRRGYALSLQGLGVGIVYITLFAAFRLYGLIPAGLSFALMALLAAFTAVLAVRQNALPLAVLGFGGAFLAPVLASTGHGNHVGLFTYCLILNLAIVWIAHRQAWKLLNLVGFIFTFALGSAWGARAYVPAHFASVEPFLVLHFLLYLLIAVQYTQQLLKAQDQGAGPLPLVDGGLLFGVPIAAFGLQASMLKGQPLALGLSAAVMSAIYLVVGRGLWRQAGERMLLLVEGLLALGVIFLALVVPLALDARWTAAAWAIQGAGILWVGLRQQRWWAAAMGLLLQLGASVSFWGAEPHILWASQVARHVTPFFNTQFLGVLLLVAAALISARLLQRLAVQQLQASVHDLGGSSLHVLHGLVLGAGVLQLWLGGWLDVKTWYPGALDLASLAAWWSLLLAMVFEGPRRTLQWPDLRWPATALLGLAALASASGLLESTSSVADSWHRMAAGWGWMEAIAVVFIGSWMHKQQLSDYENDDVLPFKGVLITWFAMLQGTILFYTFVVHGMHWPHDKTWIATVLLPTLMALYLMACAAAQRWPVAASQNLYRHAVFLPWLMLLSLWVLLANLFSDGHTPPLPYVPLLNPLDLMHGLVLYYSWRWERLSPQTQQGQQSRSSAMVLVAAGLAFWWLTSLMIRTLHHWFSTPMWIDGASDSALVQTSLTVLWALISLITMLYATRRAGLAGARSFWQLGAALLALVVLKLFTVDLANVGTLQRIVSFLAVGGLMLVIGYVSPMPPQNHSKSLAEPGRKGGPAP